MREYFCTQNFTRKINKFKKNKQYKNNTGQHLCKMHLFMKLIKAQQKNTEILI